MDFKAAANRTAIALSLLLSASGVFAAGPSYRIEVDGLACPFCAYGIEKKLNAVQGVERVETDIREGVVIVTMKDGAVLDETAATQAVKEAGFTLNGFKRVSPDSGRRSSLEG
jgi:mercuric ion binding protein